MANELIQLIQPLKAIIVDTFNTRNDFYGRVHKKQIKAVAIELNLWQTPDGRLKRVYLNGIGVKGGRYKLGYIGGFVDSDTYGRKLEFGQEDLIEQDWLAINAKATDLLDEAFGKQPWQNDAEFQQGFDDYKVQLEANA